MAAGDHYRIKASEISQQAKTEAEPLVRAELESLALAYLRLANQADRNAKTDIVYETPVKTEATQTLEAPSPQD